MFDFCRNWIITGETQRVNDSSFNNAKNPFYFDLINKIETDFSLKNNVTKTKSDEVGFLNWSFKWFEGSNKRIIHEKISSIHSHSGSKRSARHFHVQIVINIERILLFFFSFFKASRIWICQFMRRFTEIFDENWICLCEHRNLMKISNKLCTNTKFCWIDIFLDYPIK